MRIGYARVSTQDQSLNLQLDALRAAGCTRIFREKIGGKARNRPKLQAALNALGSGDHIVVWRLDRLGRDFRHLVDIAEELRGRQANIISLSEGIDTSSSIGEVVYRLICVFADFERSVIVERTRAGLAAAKARGVKLGPRSKLSPAMVDKAREYIAEGMHIEAVAEGYGVSRSTLYRYIRIGARAVRAETDYDQQVDGTLTSLHSELNQDKKPLM